MTGAGPHTSMKLLLGIETSNPTAGDRGEAGGSADGGALLGPGVALMAPGGAIIGAEPLREGSRHDDALMPAIARLCARAGAAPDDLARVAVSGGPGGYTGLRIAITTAKMIAEATGCEVVAVPSALVAAWRLGPDLAPAIVCLASKKGAAHGTLLPAAAWLAGAEALGVIGPEDIRRIHPRTIIADSYLPDAMRAAAQEIGAPVVPPQFAAESVCHLAREMPGQDPATLAPIYAREADAVTQWRARKNVAQRSGPD